MAELRSRGGPTAVAAVALLLAATSLAEDTDSDRLGPGDHELSIRHGGADRYALVHVPPQAAGGLPLPLVLDFHGGGGTPEGHRDWTGLDALADREGFVAVHPAGTPAHWVGRRLMTWNAGFCCGRARKDGVDDVGFALALLDALGARVAIDSRRVYATGMSNGGMMAMKLAHDAPDRIAAIAPVAGAARLEPFAPSARRVPILHFHSVDDPRALYAGGLGPRFPFTRHRVDHPAVEEVMAQWAQAAGCAPEPVPAGAIERAGAEGEVHTARLLRYPRCREGVEVALWQLTGAGHVWPGAPARNRRLLGSATSVVDANEEMWRFFARHALPGVDAGVP